MADPPDDDPRASGNRRLQTLTRRERQIASAYAAGDSYREIATRLFVAPTTVRTHLGAIYRKLGVSRKVDLFRVLNEASPLRHVEGQAGDRQPPRELGKRQVTVLCALPNDVPLIAAGGDPERAAALGEAFRAAVSKAVDEHRGRLLGGSAEEAMACFGTPFSDETDQERAIRCALDLSRRLGGSPDSDTMPARIGVCTGPVVAHGGKSGELLGGVPLLASALARSARGGGIVACARTRAALGSLFAFSAPAEIEVDGAGASIRCFSVEPADEFGSRFAALHGERLPPIVGRDHEVGLLQTLLESAQRGTGQAVLVTGEPGVGKSRVVRALCDWAALVDAELLFFQCSPHETTSPLHPVARTLRHLAGVDRDASAAERLDALDKLFAEVVEEGTDGRQVLAVLASIWPDAESPVDMAPDKLQRATLDLVERFVVARCKRRPLLLIVEDVHWADPTTLRWLERVIEIADGLPILAIVTMRHGDGWRAPPSSSMTRLALTRLSQGAIAEIVTQQSGSERLSAAAVARIAERSEGIPLFAEELTRAILELGEAEDAVPSTLQALLAGRLDRLGRSREVAEAAAVIGRDFEYDLLADILPHGRRALSDAIERLEASGLVLRRRGGTGGSLEFKHALVRDAAYGSLLEPRRQALHLAVAEALIARLDSGQDVAPEFVAQHLVEGGASARSVPYWYRAGEQATRRSANREAVSHLRSGLRALDAMPEGAPRERAEMKLQLALGTPLIAISGYTGSDTAAAYGRALELAERVGDTDGIFQALYGVWVNAMIRGEHRQARAVAERLVALAIEEGIIAQEIIARRVLGWSLSLLGELEDGQHEIETALTLYRQEEHGGLMLRYGQDPRIAGLSILAWSAAIRGDRRKSEAFAQQALAEAEALGHLYTMAYAIYMAGAAPSFLLRDFAAAARHVDALLAISDEQTFPFWRGFGQAMRAALMARQGEVKEAEAVMAPALVTLDSLSVGWFRPFVHGSLAQALLEAGEPQMANHHIGLARAVVEQTEERWIEPGLARMEEAIEPLGVLRRGSP